MCLGVEGGRRNTGPDLLLEARGWRPPSWARCRPIPRGSAEDLTDDPLRAIPSHDARTDGNDIRFRPPTVDDGRQIWDLARRSGTLDLNSPYAYLLLSSHFADTGVVALAGDALAGFVVGYRPPPTPDVVFVWQIAVDDAHRGRGLGAALLDELLDRTTAVGVRWLEATVTPSNEPSRRLFTAAAKHRGAELAESPLFTPEHFPGPSHEAELLFRIGPL